MTHTLSKKAFFQKLKNSTSEKPSWLLSRFEEPIWDIPNDDLGAHSRYSEDTLRITFYQSLPDGTDLTDNFNACFLSDLKRCLIFALSPYSPNRLNRFSLLCRLANELKHLAVFFAYNHIRDESGALSLSAAERWRYLEFCERAAQGGAFSVRYIKERARRLLMALAREPSKEPTSLKSILEKLGLPPNYAPKELTEIIHSFGIDVSTKSQRIVRSESDQGPGSKYHHVHKRSITRYNALTATWQYLYSARHHMESPLLFDPSEENNTSSLAPGRIAAPKRKTRSIPNDIAFSLLNLASRWCFVYQPHITTYIHDLENTLDSLRAGRTAKREYYMNKAFELVEQPEPIRELGISRYTAHKRGTYAEEQFASLSIENVRHLCTAAFFLLTATLTARRRSEIVHLSATDLVHSDGNSEILFLQRKSGRAGPNKKFSRPIPTVLSSALKHYILMDSHLRAINYPEGSSPLLVNSLGSRISTLQNLAPGRLQFFFDYLRYQHPHLPEWSLKAHQLRRLFAQLYFWHRPEATLDSLTWFLGHLSTDETLTYLTEGAGQLDFTHEQSHFISKALSATDTGNDTLTIDPYLRTFLRNNNVEISDYDSVHYHVTKLLEKGLVKSRRLRFDGSNNQPLIAIEFQHNG